MSDLEADLYGGDPTPSQAAGDTPLPDLDGLEQKYSLPSGLLHSVMHQESGGDPNAVSDAGAQGLFQFMPRTAKQYGIDPFNPNQAAEGAARMYSDLSKKYKGDVPSMLAAYNWGQGNVDRKGLGSVPNETRNYINNVMGGMGSPKAEVRMASYEPLSDVRIEAVPQNSNLEADLFGDDAKQPTNDLEKDLFSGEPAYSTDDGRAAYQGVMNNVSKPFNSAVNAVTAPIMNAVAAAGAKPAQYTANALDSTDAGQWIGDKLLEAKNAVSNIGGRMSSNLKDLESYNPDLKPDLDALEQNAQLAGNLTAGKAPLEAGEGAAKNVLANMGEGSGVSTDAALAWIPKIIPEKAPAVSSSDIRALASQKYRAAEQQGGILNPQITNSFIDKAQEVLPQTEAGRIVLGDTPTTKLVDNLEGLRDKPLTLSEAQEVDSALGDRMTSEVDPKTGKLNAEGNKLLQIQQSLREAVENAGEKDISGGKSGFDSWNQGRQLWSASLRMNDIQRILDRASMMDNPVTGIKTGFRTLASNPARLRGFTPQEVGLIKNAAKTGIVTDALRWGGSRLISSITGMAAGAASGAGELGAVAGSAVGYGAGMPLRAAANALQRGRGNAVLNAIVKRPSVQAALKPAEEAIPPSKPTLALPAPKPYAVNSRGAIATGSPNEGGIIEKNTGVKQPPLSPEPLPTPPLALPAPKPYTVNPRGVVSTGVPRSGIIERNARAAEPPLSDWPKQTLLPAASTVDSAQKVMPNNALVPHMEGVVSELENSQSGHRFFDFSPEGQGGTPNVVGIKSDSPSWFQEYNKNNPPVSKKYVRDTFEKMKTGAPLGERQQKIADIIRREGIGRYEEDAKQRSAAVDAAKFNPDDINHESAVMHDDVPFAKGGMVNTNPTDAQKEAGNYKKHHVRLHGMEIAIENPKGSVRSGRDKGGKEWHVGMPAHYGYIKGTVGADKEHMDVYVGDKPHSGRVYVVNQVHDHNGHFDEHKVILGHSNKTDAIDMYKKAFSDGKGSMRIGSVKAMSVQELKDWLKRGNTKRAA